ncbi:MAG: RidA family protein [Geminicoccaceae bacterium]
MIKERLAENGLELPEAVAPVANYVPFVRDGSVLYVSGQVPMRDGRIAVTGKLGGGVSIEQGQEAARICVLNLLAQVGAALDGDWSRLERCLKLVGFVASAPDFTDQPKVINGASDLMVDVLGENGRHARSAVGVAALPLDSAVEVEAIFACR